MKYLLTIILCSITFSFSQKNILPSDSIFENSPYISHYQNLSFLKKRIREKGYFFDLFEYHRPRFFGYFGLWGRQHHWYRDGMPIGDMFSNLLDERDVQFEWLEGIVNDNTTSYLNTLFPKNSNPFSKMLLKDGTRLYTNVTGSFFQRVNGNVGLYLGFKNTESSSLNNKNALASPHIYFGLDYYWDEKEKLIVRYDKKSKKVSDYGYLNDSFWEQQSNTNYHFFKRIDRENFLLKFYTSKWEYSFYHQFQRNILQVNRRIAEIRQYTEKYFMGANYDIHMNHRFGLFAETERANSNAFTSPVSSNKVIFKYRYLNKYFNLNIDLGYKTYKMQNNQFVYRFATMLQMDSLQQITFTFENRIASLNEQFLNIPMMQSPSQQPYFKGVLPRKDNLLPEIVSTFLWEYNIASSHKISLLGSSVFSPIQYQISDSTFSNGEKAMLLGGVLYNVEERIFPWLSVQSSLEGYFLRQKSYLPGLKASLELAGFFHIFKQLNGKLSLGGYYLGKRASVFYVNHANFFTLASNQTSPGVFHPKVELQLKVRSFLFRWRIENPFPYTHYVIQGYEVGYKQVVLDFEWIFND